MEVAAQCEVPEHVKPGIAWIKEEFLVPASKASSETAAADATTGEASVAGKRPAEGSHNDASASKKRRGQNKHRPRMPRQPRSSKLCRNLWAMTREDLAAAKMQHETVPPDPTPDISNEAHSNNGDCTTSPNVVTKCNGSKSGSASCHPLCEFPNCDYQHDVDAYLAAKPPDIGEKCHNFLTFGKCSSGLTCRFGGEHIKEGFNVVNHELWNLHKNVDVVLNSLSKDVQRSLRKKAFSFKLAEDTLKKAELEKNQYAINSNQSNGKVNSPDNKNTPSDAVGSETVQDSTNGLSSQNGASSETASEISAHAAESVSSAADNCKESRNAGRIGPASDEDLIKLKSEEKRKVIWKDQLYLAPLTTLGNLPFRRICRRLGADITCGEMAVATNLLDGHPSEWALVKRHHTEAVFGVQVCGSSPVAMVKCAELLARTANIDFVDINVGCPIDFIYQQGSGSALMRRQSALELMVRGMSSVLPCPVTVKMRTSIYTGDKVAHVLAPRCRDWGADMVTIHGRSREQRYTKTADWDYIKECVAAAAPMPVFGNGDVLSYEDYNARKQLAGVQGIMIGRGALMKPWIFTEIKEQRHWDISSSERFQILKEFVNSGLEYWGSDSEGVEKTRNFLLEWLSFLCRYIPLGLLERPPQTMNQKPPFFIGRDELETLMASKDSRDWIKLSEMLLGPVPEEHVFVPKHKANSWG